MLHPLLQQLLVYLPKRVTQDHVQRRRAVENDSRISIAGLERDQQNGHNGKDNRRMLDAHKRFPIHSPPEHVVHRVEHHADREIQHQQHNQQFSVQLRLIAAPSMAEPQAECGKKRKRKAEHIQQNKVKMLQPALNPPLVHTLPFAFCFFLPQPTATKPSTGSPLNSQISSSRSTCAFFVTHG